MPFWLSHGQLLVGKMVEGYMLEKGGDELQTQFLDQCTIVPALRWETLGEDPPLNSSSTIHCKELKIYEQENKGQHIQFPS